MKQAPATWPLAKASSSAAAVATAPSRGDLCVVFPRCTRREQAPKLPEHGQMRWLTPGRAWAADGTIGTGADRGRVPTAPSGPS